MARFNLDNYVSVDERIRRYYADHPDGTVRTHVEWRDNQAIVNAEITRNGELWATGLAFAVSLKDKGLEKCETTAIGRALANAGYVKEGEQRASREEMEQFREEMQQVDEPPRRNNHEIRAKLAALEAAGNDKTWAQQLYQHALNACQVAADDTIDEATADTLVAWLHTQELNNEATA